jgi:predicted deacylase
MNFVGTIGEFAEMIDADYATAAGIVKFLTENGVAEKTGSRASKSGKGKPSSLYTFPLKLEFDFEAKTKVKVAV